MPYAAMSPYFEGYGPSILMAVAAVLLLCWQKLSIRLDPAEPPLLKPTVPYIGHIIGIFQHAAGYFDILNAKKPVPIATLPMINQKLYLINSPALIQSAYKSKALSFEPFMVEFAQTLFGLDASSMIPIKDQGDETRASFLDTFIRELHGSMIGKHLHKMNADTLNWLAPTFNELGKTFETESLWLWLRDVMTMATCNGLLGSHNPMRKDPSLIEDLWIFESGIMNFIINIPEFIAPKSYRARRNIQTALIRYYAAEHDHDEDVAQITKARANVYRKHKIPATDIGKFEIGLLQVATANAIPTIFWLVCFLYSNPETLAVIREELLTVITTSAALTTDGRREITIDITKFDTYAPVFVSSYRETIRLADSHIGNRRVMADTTITDGKRSYLLRKGVDVQWASGVQQTSHEIWGPDVESFSSTRFLKSENISDQEKEQKRAYMPFGGGKHLCPGRNFAFAEILGTVALMVLGFDVEAVDGGRIVVPQLGRANLGEGIAKPRGKGSKMGAKLTRREGWEDVVWKFAC